MKYLCFWILVFEAVVCRAVRSGNDRLRLLLKMDDENGTLSFCLTSARVCLERERYEGGGGEN